MNVSRVKYDSPHDKLPRQRSPRPGGYFSFLFRGVTAYSTSQLADSSIIARMMPAANCNPSPFGGAFARLRSKTACPTSRAAE